MKMRDEIGKLSAYCRLSNSVIRVVRKMTGHTILFQGLKIPERKKSVIIVKDKDCIPRDNFMVKL